MRIKYIMLSLVAILSFSLASCNDDDDNLKYLPQAVTEAFAAKYPSSTVRSWELEMGYYVADFINEGREAEAWFKADGTWVETDTDYRQHELPKPVNDYIAANYPGYYVDDADLIQTPTEEFFRIELDKNGAADVIIKIKADGTLHK